MADFTERNIYGGLAEGLTGFLNQKTQEIQKQAALQQAQAAQMQQMQYQEYTQQKQQALQMAQQEAKERDAENRQIKFKQFENTLAISKEKEMADYKKSGLITVNPETNEETIIEEKGPGGKYEKIVQKVPSAMNTPISDVDAETAAKQIASGMLPPAVVNKYFSTRTGAGIMNTTKINSALQKQGVNPEGFDLGDYEQSYAQEQKNRGMFQNIGNARKDSETLDKVASEYGNGKYRDWNKFLMNIAGRTGDVSTAKYNTAYQGYIDSISLALGPANAASTDERLKLAKSMANPAQSAAQIKSVLEENKILMKNRQDSMEEQGIGGFRKRQGLPPLKSRFGTAESETKESEFGEVQTVLRNGKPVKAKKNLKTGKWVEVK